MGRRKKMNAEEMEKWLLSQGAVPVTEKMKKNSLLHGKRTRQNAKFKDLTPKADKRRRK